MLPELYILSQDDKLITILTTETGLISTKVRDELNQIADEPFSFTVDADYEEAQYVVEENQVVLRDLDGDLRLYVIKEIDDQDNIDGPITTATCIPAFAEELREHVIEDRRFYNSEAQPALTAAVQGTRWTGVVEGEFGIASTNFYYINSLDAVWDVRGTWGGDLKDIVIFDKHNNIVSRQLKLLQRLGTDWGKRFEIDYDIEEIQRTILSYPVTALYGRGASLEVQDDEGNHTGGYTRYIDFADVEWKVSNGDPVNKPKGQKWVGDPKALEKYGRLHNGQRLHREAVWQNGDIENPIELLRATWEQLQVMQYPEINYRLTVQLLEKIAGYEHEKVRLGDTARAIDRQFSRPIEVQSRIIAFEYDLLDFNNTAVVEIGQFLSINQYDDRIDRLKEENDRNRGKINEALKPITDERFPNITPLIPENFKAETLFKSIMLTWDYDRAKYIATYEVYGSQIQGFVPDESNLLWRGRSAGYGHVAEVDEQWYFRVRAVNTHGVAGPFSDELMAQTTRIISDDILFGEELAAELRVLSETADLLADKTIDLEKIKQDALNKIQEDANQYTDAEIKATEVSLMSELGKKTGFDYVDGKLFLVNEELLNKVENGVYQNKILQIDNSLDGLSLRAQNVEANINDLTGEVSTAKSQIANLDIKANGIVQSVSEVRSDLQKSITIDDTRNDNQPPSFYWTNYQKQVVEEFKYRATLSVSKGETYGVLITVVPWSDSSGGYIKQTFRTGDFIFERRSTGNETWSVWRELEDTAGSQKKVNDAVGPINSRLTSAETKIDQTAYDLTFKASQTSVDGLTGRMSTAESSLNVQAGQIASKVEKNGIVSAINQTPESVKIQARLIDLQGDVYITNGKTKITDLAVGNAAIANGAITKVKIGDAAVGFAQIEKAVITDELISPVAKIDFAKIAKVQIVDAMINSVSANKLTSGTVDANKVTVTGPINIVRPDGAVAVNNGVMQGDFVVDRATPFYMDTEVSVSNNFFMTRSFSSVIADALYFKHAGRFLTFVVWARTLQAGCRVDLVNMDSGESVKVNATLGFPYNDRVDSTFQTITIDLGRPTYRNIGIYLKFNSYAQGVPTYMRYTIKTISG
ncbi:phage tail spike protein [Cytobacillus horneckiae]|uniref:phage tail spike protein n=1 Tax=Cytobacillus horneckiae TaxID=549687 RepID=UPI003D9A77DB